jgi:hypothetical protein
MVPVGIILRLHKLGLFMSRLSLAVIAFVLGATSASAGESSIGTVRRVQAHVDALRAADILKLGVASPLLADDLLRSGKKARLEAELIDGTKFTLGESAELKLDSYVFDPKNSARNRLIARIQGAFLFLGGKIEGAGSDVKIITANAVMGVRGTTFWGGPIDNAYGVLALSGVVTVSTNAGSVTLTEGQGTMITSAGAPPEAPRTWPGAKRNRAIAMISFE